MSTSSSSSSDKDKNMVDIALASLRSLQVAKTFQNFHHKDRKCEISSIDFSDDGCYCLTASADDRHLFLYDCKEGKYLKKISSMKYGCKIARFTHDNTSCLHTSSAGDDHSIRYLSMHDIQYLQYFKGHEAEVTSLEVSPSDDMFVTAAKDDTVRLWSLNDKTAIGKLVIPSPCLVAWDPAGMVIAVASQTAKTISLYNAQVFEEMPFATFEVQCSDKAQWISLEFSTNEQHILLGTDYGYHYILDAFEGTILKRLTGHEPLPNRKSLTTCRPICFSMDGNFVLAGSGSKQITVWDIAGSHYSEVEPSVYLNSPSAGQVIACNPELYLLATGEHELNFWLPTR